MNDFIIILILNTVIVASMVLSNMLGLPGGFARNLNIWGGVGWGGVACVNVGVHVYTWYAAGVLMCTHGTLLVCSCVHMVRCWCVHVYTWYAAGMFMCTHGTLLVC